MSVPDEEVDSDELLDAEETLDLLPSKDEFALGLSED